jgi:hypothetical protein
MILAAVQSGERDERAWDPLGRLTEKGRSGNVRVDQFAFGREARAVVSAVCA